MFHLDQLLDRFSMANIDVGIDFSSNLGTLSTISTELLLQIFQHLTVQDLVRFRRCNCIREMWSKES
ncbi:hypothetical protein P154DRAFT_164514 [Amniculicola lignicola CBS 123094]|uniref:F-box domain-containing protein n=1 Tax=Amniculicola lignicola CBS 123094 TaxID=1392246 RepID=A0A6A5WJB0_9PLEO|nr:hypothetical protein P154DRAFT_164514 [Amniculicola lignicola CBS 123094]